MACHDFLAYASDQLPHLRSSDRELACYVGRRLDPCWRRLDWFATQWLGNRYQEVVPRTENTDDIDLAVARACELPPLEGAGNTEQSNVDAARHLEATASLIEGMVSRSQRSVDVRDVAITMHLARRSFSAYRVSKYRWLEEERAAGRYQPEAAYRWLEV